MTPAAIVGAIVGALARQVTEWLSGERHEEPPALVHLGIPELELTMLRERAAAARELRQ